MEPAYIKANGSHCFLLSRVSQNCFFYTIMDLMLSIGCKEVESSDVEAEFARFCELSWNHFIFTVTNIHLHFNQYNHYYHHYNNYWWCYQSRCPGWWDSLWPHCFPASWSSQTHSTPYKRKEDMKSCKENVKSCKPVLMQAEAVCSICPFDQQLDVVSNISAHICIRFCHFIVLLLLWGSLNQWFHSLHVSQIIKVQTRFSLKLTCWASQRRSWFLLQWGASWSLWLCKTIKMDHYFSPFF